MTTRININYIDWPRFVKESRVRLRGHAPSVYNAFTLYEVLQSYGARNVPNSPYIEFDDERDAAVFVLRWK